MVQCPLFHQIINRARQTLRHLLLQIADFSAGLKNNLAAVRLFLARDDAQQRRFALPVAAEQTDPLAPFDLQGCVLQERRTAVTDFNIL